MEVPGIMYIRYVVITPHGAMKRNTTAEISILELSAVSSYSYAKNVELCCFVGVSPTHQEDTSSTAI